MTRKEVLDKLQNLFGAGSNDQDVVVFKVGNTNIMVYPADLAANRGIWTKPLMATRMSRIDRISFTGWETEKSEERYLTVYIKSKEDDFFNIRLD